MPNLIKIWNIHFGLITCIQVQPRDRYFNVSLISFYKAFARMNQKLFLFIPLIEHLSMKWIFFKIGKNMFCLLNFLLPQRERFAVGQKLNFRVWLKFGTQIFIMYGSKNMESRKCLDLHTYVRMGRCFCRAMTSEDIARSFLNFAHRSVVKKL